MDCAGGARAPVEETVQNRHVRAASSPVESAVRAAGGFPTQGGGWRVAVRVARALGAKRAGV
jgi:hypothetical protein